MTEEQQNIWEQFYVINKKKNLLFPSETLIRIFKGDYISNFEFKNNNKQFKILDIGFGSGNNLIFFNSLGFKVYGTEITTKICKTIKKELLKHNVKSVLKKGDNQNLPFRSNFFDCLVSWDVIHYEKSISSYKKSIDEYLRVLKPGGRLILSTMAPKSSMFLKSERIDDTFIICKNKNDIRFNQKFICFKNILIFKTYYNNKFSSNFYGRHTSIIFEKNYDSFLFTGKKNK